MSEETHQLSEDRARNEEMELSNTNSGAELTSVGKNLQDISSKSAGMSSRYYRVSL